MSKNIYCALILTLTIFQFAFALPNDDLFKKYPQNRTTKLNDGTVLPLPLYDQHCKQLMIRGTINYKKAQKILDAYGLSSVTVPLPTAALGVTDCSETSIGAYQEVSIILAVTSNSKAGVIKEAIALGAIENRKLAWLAKKMNAPQVRIFVWKMQVNEQFPIQVGRDIWNYPKTFNSQIKLNDLSSEKIFVVGDANLGVTSLRAVLKVNSNQKLTPFELDFSFILPRFNDPYSFYSAHTVERGLGFKEKFVSNSPNSTLEINPASELGAALESIEFVPKEWQFVSDAQVVSGIE